MSTRREKTTVRRPTHRTALLPALALTALLAGCGGGDDDAVSTTDPTPTSAAPSPSATATPSESASASATPRATPSATATASTASSADAVARAKLLAPKINLRASDLPGFTSTAPEEDDDDDDLPPAALTAAATCLGLTEDETEQFLGDDEEDRSEVASRDFSLGKVPGLELNSSVDVSEEGGVNGEEFKRFFPLIYSEKGAGCLGDLFAAGAEAGVGDGTEVSVVDTSVLKVPALAGQKTGGIRVRLTATIQGQKLGFEFFYATTYQDDVAVTLVGVGTGRSIPQSTFLALSGTLGKRVAAAV